MSTFQIYEVGWILLWNFISIHFPVPAITTAEYYFHHAKSPIHIFIVLI